METGCSRAFLGSKLWKEGSKLPSPRHGAGKAIWESVRNFLSRIPSPHPHPQPARSPPLLPPGARAALHPRGPLPPSNPLPSWPFFPAAALPLPDPVSPPSPPSRTLPSLARPHLNGVGGPGVWPPPQPGCGGGGGGWLSLCLGRGVGAEGATGLGGVLAPAEGGEASWGGWAHSRRMAGGVPPAPARPPFLLSRRAGAAAAARPPTPPRRPPASGAGQEVGAVMGGPLCQSLPRDAGGFSPQLPVSSSY